MSDLSLAAALLHKATADVTGNETVTYTRASGTPLGSVSVTNAVPSKPELPVEDQIVGRLRAEALDWIVLAASLVISTQVIVPQQGDKITRVNGDVYELESPPYRLSDSSRTRLRLYTKRVK